MSGFVESVQNNEAAVFDATGGFSSGLVTIHDHLGQAAEAYRALRTNLLYAHVDYPPEVVLVTSSGSGEGRSITCANLAVVLARANKRTLILDCDLRRPAMHELFGLRDLGGIVDVLTGELGPSEVLQEPMPGLKVLPAGAVPDNPAELLGSRRFAEFLAWAREEFDYVLIDAPPVGLVSDPLILATQADGVLLVVKARGTRRSSLRRSLRSLEAVEANVLGTVVNGGAPPRRRFRSRRRYDARG